MFFIAVSFPGQNKNGLLSLSIQRRKTVASAVPPWFIPQKVCPCIRTGPKSDYGFHDNGRKDRCRLLHKIWFGAELPGEFSQELPLSCTNRQFSEGMTWPTNPVQRLCFWFLFIINGFLWNVKSELVVIISYTHGEIVPIIVKLLRKKIWKATKSLLC